MREKQCETCIYFDPREHPQQSGQVQMGDCRAGPPIMVGISKTLFISLTTIPPERKITEGSYADAQFGVWPTVRCCDWCGQHKENPPLEKKHVVTIADGDGGVKEIDPRTLRVVDVFVGQTRVLNVLRRELALDTLGDLAQFTLEEISDTRNVGATTLKAIISGLSAYGLHLR